MANKKPAPGQRHAASPKSDSSDDFKSQYEDWIYWANDHWLQNQSNQKAGANSFLASVLLGNFNNNTAKLFIVGRVIEVPISNSIRLQLESSSIGLGDDILVFYEMRDSIPIITQVWFSSKSPKTTDPLQKQNAVGKQIDLLSKALGSVDKTPDFDKDISSKVNLSSEDNSAANQHEDLELSDENSEETVPWTESNRKTTPIVLRLSPELLDAVNKTAEMDNADRTNWIRKAIREKIIKSRKLNLG